MAGGCPGIAGIGWGRNFPYPIVYLYFSILFQLNFICHDCRQS